MKVYKLIAEALAATVVILLLIGESENLAVTVLMKLAALSALGGVAIHYWRRDKKKPQR